MITIEDFKNYCDLGNTKGIVNKFNVPDDATIQLILNQSQKICLGMIGNPDDVPTTDTFKTGVFFLGRYYLETRSKSGSQLEGDIEIITERKVVQGIDDLRTHQGVMRVLSGMLASDRNPTAFMPELSNVST